MMELQQCVNNALTMAESAIQKKNSVRQWPTQILSQGITLCASTLDLLWFKASTYTYSPQSYPGLMRSRSQCCLVVPPFFSVKAGASFVRSSEMVVETRLMSSSCLPTPSKPDYRAYKPPNKTPVSGKTGLSLTKISPSFRSLVLLKLSRCKSRYTVPGAFA